MDWGDVWYAYIQEKLNTETDRQICKITQMIKYYWQFHFNEFKGFEQARIFWQWNMIEARTLGYVLDLSSKKFIKYFRKVHKFFLKSCYRINGTFMECYSSMTVQKLIA